MKSLPYPNLTPGADAHYDIDEVLDLSDVVPMVAKPYSPGNAFPAEDIARERITFDKAFIGSCTNGSYDDLLQAALVAKRALEAGFKTCLLYTSDAADERSSVDLGGRRI